ncbi:MAG: hypothetical protein AAF517_06995 [Planctomycetota bacterium]
MTVFLMIAFGALALFGALTSTWGISLVCLGLTACAAVVHSAVLISAARIRAAEITAQASREKREREREESIANELQEFRQRRIRRSAGDRCNQVNAERLGRRRTLPPQERTCA